MGRPIGAKEVPGIAARLLLQRPEQVAGAWQSARCLEEGGEPQERVLEGVVVSFLREIGAQIAGASGSAWERTQGVLKLCAREGTEPIYSELATLRRVVDSALELLKAPAQERMIAGLAIDEATAAAVLAHEHLRRPELRVPDSQRSGVVVVERFKPFGRRHEAPEELDDADLVPGFGLVPAA